MKSLPVTLSLNMSMRDSLEKTNIYANESKRWGRVARSVSKLIQLAIDSNAKIDAVIIPTPIDQNAVVVCVSIPISYIPKIESAYLGITHRRRGLLALLMKGIEIDLRIAEEQADKE